jgi:hypothetical protein
MANHKHSDAKKQARPGTDENGRAQGTAQRLIQGIEANPLAVVAGGLALGAVAGAILPRSQRERDLLAPVGVKLGGALTAAVAAAREAGQGELDNAGINRDAARDQVRSLVDGLLKAASSAGTAAVHAAASGKSAA